MRFAIATIDRYLGVFETFARAGWQPLKLFTIPFGTELANQQAVIAYAEKYKAAIQLSPMTARDLQELQAQGCEALIVASYDWKIPDWSPFLKYAVNFHSAPLPEGRGPYPVVRAILENRDRWGVVCHKLTADLDAGDILDAEAFPLQPDECHESLDLKVQMAAKRLAQRMTEQMPEMWAKAKPQGEGSYWPRYTMEQRVIDFKKPVKDVLRHIRAFGASESIANLYGTWLLVKRALGWVEIHNHPPGHVAHTFNRNTIVAVPDGYVVLLEWDFAPPHVVEELKPVALPQF